MKLFYAYTGKIVDLSVRHASVQIFRDSVTRPNHAYRVLHLHETLWGMPSVTRTKTVTVESLSGLACRSLLPGAMLKTEVTYMLLSVTFAKCWSPSASRNAINAKWIFIKFGIWGALLRPRGLLKCWLKSDQNNGAVYTEWAKSRYTVSSL